MRYDPTPPDLRLAGAQALSARDRFAELQSALEFWWFRNVIDFDRSRQAAALRGLWMAWHEWRNPARVARERGGGPEAARAPALPLPPLAWLAAPGRARASRSTRGGSAARGGRADAVPAYYRRRSASSRGAAARGARPAIPRAASPGAQRDELPAEPAARLRARSPSSTSPSASAGGPRAEAGPAALVRAA